MDDEKKKVDPARLSVVVAAVLVVCLAGCGGTTKTAEEVQEAARKEATQRQIVELARKHGAKTDWSGSINETSLRHVFALKLQQAIDPLIGHPILLVGWVNDIYRTKDGYCLICSRSSTV